MSIINRMQKQSAVYWPLAGSDSGSLDYDDFGLPVVTTPEEIDCRWEARSEEYLDSNGTTRLSNAVVYVEKDVDVGGILMLGIEDDITDPVNIKENEGAYEIKRFDKLPTFKATEFLRTVYI